jgi:hypothetical protein
MSTFQVTFNNAEYDVDIFPMIHWLQENIGPHAGWPGAIYEDRAWCQEVKGWFVTYHFLREQDAVLFTLRWV